MRGPRRPDAVRRRGGRGGWPWAWPWRWRSCWPAARSAGTRAASLADPGRSVSPSPDYPDVCAPVGADTSGTCLRLTLDGDRRGAGDEGCGPWSCPSDFPRLSVPEQLFVAVDRERVDRGSAPFTGLDHRPRRRGAEGAPTAAHLPARPGPAYGAVATEWIGEVDNGLDADFQWMYDDGPDSGVPGCSGDADVGLLGRPRHRARPFRVARHLVMGAAFDPDGDTSRRRPERVLVGRHAGRGQSRDGAYAYTWKQALAAMAAGTAAAAARRSRRRSRTPGSPTLPQRAPAPDYTRVCAAGGLDDSPACIGAVLAAVNHAHALEGVRPWCCRPGSRS